MGGHKQPVPQTRRTTLPLPLPRRSASPRIVNMASVVGSLTRESDPAGETGPLSLAYSPSNSFLNAVTVQYAKELADTNILINAGCPGCCATDLNGHRGYRMAEQGAAIGIRLATLPDDGPTGDPPGRRPDRRLLRRPGRCALVVPS